MLAVVQDHQGLPVAQVVGDHLEQGLVDRSGICRASVTAWTSRSVAFQRRELDQVHASGKRAARRPRP
ncbi:hypothetical protein [Nonomuraea dietziae]|uniref:hypothetical protein n=1 Tax=Nonomuraea dietziae TaxID=65515 RepID=UPI0031CF63C8